ncbi:MAG: helix-turn-helix domain-containing protein [Clostridia bacterium]|nr:helix-turn-helix domain-containing protein [Clostridia bacterium]
MNPGKRISALRKEAGLSQESLAEKLAVSRSLVAKWETGLQRPDRQSVEMMAELFGVAPESIDARDPLAESELAPFLPAEDAPDRDRLVRSIEEFLYSLSEKERNIFIRRYYFYDRPAEIAGRYGLSQSAVRTGLHRSRKKLKVFFAGRKETWK